MVDLSVRACGPGVTCIAYVFVGSVQEDQKYSEQAHTTEVPNPRQPNAGLENRHGE